MWTSCTAPWELTAKHLAFDWPRSPDGRWRLYCGLLTSNFFFYLLPNWVLANSHSPVRSLLYKTASKPAGWSLDAWSQSSRAHRCGWLLVQASGDTLPGWRDFSLIFFLVLTWHISDVYRVYGHGGIPCLVSDHIRGQRSDRYPIVSLWHEWSDRNSHDFLLTRLFSIRLYAADKLFAVLESRTPCILYLLMRPFSRLWYHESFSRNMTFFSVAADAADSCKVSICAVSEHVCVHVTVRHRSFAIRNVIHQDLRGKIWMSNDAWERGCSLRVIPLMTRLAHVAVIDRR